MTPCRDLSEHTGVTDVTQVNVAANKLMMLTDKHFEAWANVSVLNLYENNLVRLGSLAPLVALEELRLNGNNLEEMPTLGPSHPKLSVIELHKNRIAACAAEYFTATPGLTRLSLNGNSLTELPPSLTKCEGLLGVQAQENQIASLPADALPPSLETLFLQDNKPLTSLPAWLPECKKLKRVNLGSLELDEAAVAVAEALKDLVLSADEGIFWDAKGE